MNYLKLTRDSIIEHGWRATLNRALDHIRRQTFTYFDWWFDVRHRVETCSLRSIHDLDVDSPRADLVGYEPTPVRAIRRMLRSLAIRHSEFTFVDFGSGKGRVLLLASEFPYRRIIGLELSPSLHEVALRNISHWTRSSRQCGDITSVLMDATAFALPDDPLVLFFFTPFLEPVLSEVVTHIEERLERSPHALYILYYGSRPELIDQFRRLDLHYKSVYSTSSPFFRGSYTGHLFFREP